MKALDLFAGFGGFTAGAELAGIDVVWAANHWPLAVETHALNHPSVEHVCQDLRQADWTQLPAFDLLLASPACQPHSTASQPKRRPHHDAMRATAWAVVDCADTTEPRAILVENVPSFRRWRLFPQWCDALRGIGYHLTEAVVNATDHGVPQRRNRLLIAGHRRPGFRFRSRALHAVEPAFGPCIEWDAGEWRPIGNASADAQARIAKGRARLGHAAFLSQHVTGHPGVALTEAVRTITTKDQWIVVRGNEYRPFTVREYARAMGFSDSYGWPAHASRSDTVCGLGNAVPPPVARDAVRDVAEAA